MNKQHLTNLLEMAKIAMQSGKISAAKDTLACGAAMVAAEETLASMSDGQPLLPAGLPTGAAKSIADLNKEGRPKPLPPHEMKAMKKDFSKAGAVAGENADKPE